jgi:hypothetical protein
MVKDRGAFLQSLEKARKDLRDYISIEQIFSGLGDWEKDLAIRMQCYSAPVILDGLLALDPEFPDLSEALNALVRFSLVEVEFDHDLHLPKYRLSSLVAEWLENEKGLQPSMESRQKAALYLLYFFKNLKPTISEGLEAHQSLMNAGLEEEAHKLVLRWLAYYFYTRGMYRQLLEKWLPPLLKSRDKSTRGAALGRIGTTFLSLSTMTRP